MTALTELEALRSYDNGDASASLAEERARGAALVAVTAARHANELAEVRRALEGEISRLKEANARTIREAEAEKQRLVGEWRDRMEADRLAAAGEMEAAVAGYRRQVEELKRDLEEHRVSVMDKGSLSGVVSVHPGFIRRFFNSLPFLITPSPNQRFINLHSTHTHTRYPRRRR